MTDVDGKYDLSDTCKLACCNLGWRRAPGLAVHQPSQKKRPLLLTIFVHLLPDFCGRNALMYWSTPSELSASSPISDIRNRTKAQQTLSETKFVQVFWKLSWLPNLNTRAGDQNFVLLHTSLGQASKCIYTLFLHKMSFLVTDFLPSAGILVSSELLRDIYSHDDRANLSTGNFS